MRICVACQAGRLEPPPPAPSITSACSHPSTEPYTTQTTCTPTFGLFTLQYSHLHSHGAWWSKPPRIGPLYSSTQYTPLSTFVKLMNVTSGLWPELLQVRSPSLTPFTRARGYLLSIIRTSTITAQQPTRNKSHDVEDK